MAGKNGNGAVNRFRGLGQKSVADDEEDSYFQIRNNLAIPSPIMRERTRRKERDKLVEKERALLPKCSTMQMKRLRMSFLDALFDELAENGYNSTVAFVKQLIELQETLRELRGPDSAMWKRPKLRNSKNVLTKLVLSLQKAERAHYADNIAAECDEFLSLSVHYAFGRTDTWWWLAEQLLLQTLRICTAYKRDGGERNAMSRLFYGKFYMENVYDRMSAMEQLRQARKMSAGRRWSATRFLPSLKRTVFVEVCLLIYNELIRRAQTILIRHPKLAHKMCLLAKFRARDGNKSTCSIELESKAMMLQGECELNAGDLSGACVTFYTVLSRRLRENNDEEVCETRIALVSAFLKRGNSKQAYDQLRILLKFCKEHQLQFFLGQAYRYLGEYYLVHGVPDKAIPLFMRALNAFHQIDDHTNKNHTKNFAAVATGQHLLPEYINFILRCDNLECLLELVKWKDTRELTWSNMFNDLTDIYIGREQLSQASKKSSTSGGTITSENRTNTQLELLVEEELMKSQEAITSTVETEKLIRDIRTLQLFRGKHIDARTLSATLAKANFSEQSKTTFQNIGILPSKDDDENLEDLASFVLSVNSS